MQETKFADRRFAARAASGYTILATDAPSAHCGGVALLYKESAQFELEEATIRGNNVISFELETGSERYFVVGAYIPPSENDASTIKCVTDAFTNRPKGYLPLLIGGPEC